jgi:hypothetical protein
MISARYLGLGSVLIQASYMTADITDDIDW